MPKPRTYLADKQVSHLRSLPHTTDRTIPLNARLHDIRSASELLTEQYGKGYSTKAMRRWIRSGEWQEGWHYVRRGRIIKIYLPAVQEWQVSGQ